MASVEIFPLILDLLIYLPRVLQLYHNYQQMVQLVLEVMYECIKEMLCYLDEVNTFVNSFLYHRKDYESDFVIAICWICRNKVHKFIIFVWG